MNKEQKDNSFKANRRLYIILICVSSAIMMLCLILPQNSSWFTIATGIGCGGFASTIVAWLIDEANTKRDREKVNADREILFKELNDSFRNGLQILIYFTNELLQDDDSRNWIDWVREANRIAKDDCDFRKYFINSMRVFFDDISDKMFGIQSQSAIMLEHGIIMGDDVTVLSFAQTICEFARTEFRMEASEEKLMDSITRNCNLIRGAIENSPAMRSLNHMIIEPTIYNKIKKDEG